MSSSRSRIGLVLAAVVFLVGGFLLAKNSDSGEDDQTSTAVTTTTVEATTTTAGTQVETTPTVETVPEPKAVAIDVVGGKPQGGVQDIKVDKGDDVSFTVNSDVADEIHVHGYDLMKDVEAGGSVTFSFKAKIDGKFEIELEGAGVRIASLTVNP